MNLALFVHIFKCPMKETLINQIKRLFLMKAIETEKLREKLSKKREKPFNSNPKSKPRNTIETKDSTVPTLLLNSKKISIFWKGYLLYLGSITSR